MQKHFPTRQHLQRDVGLICLWVGIWSLEKVVACTMWNFNAKIIEMNELKAQLDEHATVQTVHKARKPHTCLCFGRLSGLYLPK